MQDVELVKGHAVEGMFQIVDGLEGPAAIEHQPAPRESWRVLKAQTRHFPGCADVPAAAACKQLEQGLGAAEDSRWLRRAQSDLLRSHLQDISFSTRRSTRCLVQTDDVASSSSRACPQRQGKARL